MREELLDCGISIRPMTAGGSQPVVPAMSAAWSASAVFGEGQIDLVFFPGFVSNIDVYWEEPLFARWLRKLAAFARVITFDKLARACLTGSPTMDKRMDAR